MAATELPREEVQAAAAARQDLAQELEPVVLDALVDRIDKMIDARVEARLAERGRGGTGDGGSVDATSPVAGARFARDGDRDHRGGVGHGLGGLIVAWSGIAAINIANALRGRRSSR